MSHGYTAELAELEYGTSKFYKIYYLRNEETGDERLLYNWGKQYAANGGDGQYKVDMEVWNRWDKVNEKRKKGYTVTRNWEQVSVGWGILKEAGVAQVKPPTPVELKGLEKFTTELNDLIAMLGQSRLTPDMVVQFATLREQLSALQREVQDAEGRMEVLTAMMHVKFEEES